MSEDPRRVLFVCIENSNRSQMAEALARMRGGSRVEAYSAGSQPGQTVNPVAVALMREIGYDLTKHHAKSLDEVPDIEYDAVVTMGCGDACPHVKSKERQDWTVPDPRSMPPGEIRLVRDLIDRKVRRLIETLLPGPPST